MSIRTRILAILVMVAPVIAFPSSRPPSARAASASAGLPTTFGFGLSASPDSNGIYGWMPNSNVPWNYAYQYLSGGVNTGSGWETWNTSGQFALYYAQGAASHSYIPVFSYYELLQSTGTCGSCGEAQKDLSNLDNTSTMASYFANFRILMQRLGSGTYGGISGFGKTAIVHVEPDLSGYAEQAALNSSQCYGYCTAQGNNPSLVKAAVASSGDADVHAYPNTYQGFNWALLHLRDLYAPNVKLAFHVSNWASGSDISSNTGALDAATLGQSAGSFAAQSGITGAPAGTSSYDLLFNDVSDRDASYYKYVYNNPNVWWDRTNTTFPNFHRWETYVKAASQTAGRSVMVWQVPEGNQYYDTENNTNGHYQDNRAEYFYSHVPELVQSNIIGVLFGAGNGGSTVHTDGMKDGITNPAAICNADGYGDGVVRCANHTSTSSDDDGGYIRQQGQAYYAAGAYPLSGGGSTTPTPTATNTPTATPTSTPTVTKTPISTATRTPVPTATKTPVPTATSTPAPAVIINSASANPPTVLRGGSTKLSTIVTSNRVLTGAIIDFEVYNSAGSKVYQNAPSTTLSANTPQTITVTWTVPSTQATGNYTLKVGVFGSGWTPLYAWSNSAASVTVQ